MQPRSRSRMLESDNTQFAGICITDSLLTHFSPTYYRTLERSARRVGPRAAANAAARLNQIRMDVMELTEKSR